ncbi:hypothetical protein Celf_3056 [Cellulomonas fimi ATCC 484]|uniref:Uncharacterized protein n=1 Tax=Cellulomonas fimi (strain ATCC 484 / DSM 20113 / JCM 1341 / CCUG 24087 / LMG 16345 / NBRC 15513 / NCIMB 8980 / NCTC 7547 / NRS-133) TaxID=590998 RepID=F4GZ57_CELFA|nr:hypothetical protein Celf_3056 [Cellulomonas fimi ATCC 484]VEH35484.1 Uncharacterised protein [Cellulomonas fimi]
MGARGPLAGVRSVLGVTALAPARPTDGAVTHTVRVVLLAATLGLAWGAATSFLQTVLPDPVSGLANAVAPWLVVPFVVGARARGDGTAAAAGLLACALQVVGYYVTSDLRGYGVATATVLAWTVTAALGGPLFGIAGRTWLTGEGRRRGLGEALLVGVWFTEAVVGFGVRLHYYDDAVVFALVAALLLLTLGRRPGPLTATLRWLAAVVPAGAVGMLLLDPLLRALS